MKTFFYWLLAVVITLAAAYYQRKTGPTYPARIETELNDSLYQLKLVRSLGHDERSEVKLNISDTSIKAKLFYRRYPTNDDYTQADFTFRTYPVKSFIMNKIFKIFEEEGLFADIPQQPAAGKIQYFVELNDSSGTKYLAKEDPLVIRFKGEVPSLILLPHVLLMFIAMLFSTLAGIMSLGKHPSFRKYSVWTLILFIAGGIILGPIVQLYAFGDLWTGVPFGWDLTDNKTLIALIFWILAVYMNRKKEKPVYVAIAAIVLLLVYSIPHSVLGSELDYQSGEITQGIIMNYFLK